MTATPKLAASDPDLMRFAACAADYADMITDRWDIVVRAGKGLGHGAPACFIPATAEIELDAVECMAADKPRLDKVGWSIGAIDMVRPRHRALIPVTVGALAHECGHSLYTLWPERYREVMASEPKQVVDLAMALEEGRHETRLYNRDPDVAPFMRRMLSAIILPGFAKVPADDPYALMYAAALLFPRCLASGWLALSGSGEAYPYVNVLVAHLDAVIGHGTVSKMARAMDDPAIGYRKPEADANDAVLRVAREWWALLPASAKDPSPAGSGAGESCPGHEEGHGAPSSSGSGPDAMESAKSVARDVERTAASGEDEKAVEEATESEKSVGGSEASERAAKRPGGKHGHSPRGVRGSGVTGTRVPTPAESATAKRLGNVLRGAQIVAKVKAPTATPPGRLRGRAAVGWARDRAMGKATNVDLFRGKTRDTYTPPVRLGIAMDVSGSMSGACDMAASLGWTVAAAAWDAEALVSAVCFGADIYPYVSVGKASAKVKTLGAMDGTEVINSAITYLDDELDLAKGDGPRILVIISDGCYVHSYERSLAAKWLKAFTASGGVVIYVGREAEAASRYLEGFPIGPANGAYDVPGDLATLAASIGKVIRKAYDAM